MSSFKYLFLRPEKVKSADYSFFLQTAKLSVNCAKFLKSKDVSLQVNSYQSVCSILSLIKLSTILSRQYFQIKTFISSARASYSFIEAVGF